MAVVREDAAMLTRLFPIKMVLSILLYRSWIFCTRRALLLPSSARERILTLLTQVKAVSAEEKNPDKISNKNKMIHCMILLVSKAGSFLRNVAFININSFRNIFHNIGRFSENRMYDKEMHHKNIH